MNFYVSFWSFIVLLVLGLHTSSGARGGGSRGGSSRSGSSRSSRSSSTSRSSVRFGTRSNYGGPRYSSGSWKSNGAYETLWGVSSYQSRRLYISHPDIEPSICFNEDNLRNGTYGYFICPEDGQSDDYDSCCGDENSQVCCPFSLSQAAIAGIVIGVVIGCPVIIIAVVWIITELKSRCCEKQRETAISESAFRGRRVERLSIIYTTPPELNTVPPAGTAAYSYSPTEQKDNSLTPHSEEPQNQLAPIGFTDSKAPLPTQDTADDSASTHYSANEAPPYPTGEFTQATGDNYSANEAPPYPTGEFAPPTGDNYSANEAPHYPTDEFTQPTGGNYSAYETPLYPTGEFTQPTGDNYLATEALPCPTGEFTQPTGDNYSATEAPPYPTGEFTQPTGDNYSANEDPPYPTGEFTQPTGANYSANEAHPYPTDEFTQPTGPDNAPSVDPPPYSSRN